jgi:hypothetical protein
MHLQKARAVGVAGPHYTMTFNVHLGYRKSLDHVT